MNKGSPYKTVTPGNFQAMIDVDRYGARSSAFDDIISATHEHFWDPLDRRYIDFSEPFDLENTPMIPEIIVPELSTEVGARLVGKTRTAFINRTAHWLISNILHGEQGALSLSASLCQLFHDPGAQEYAANQVREEARHVTAFSRYIQARWGKPLAPSGILADLLDEIVKTGDLYKKIVGMQMLVEGLAMGAFATFYEKAADPVLVRLTQLAMTDEAFHHKFGKIWAANAMPALGPGKHAEIEDWAAQCFQALLLNLVSPAQKKALYPEFGLGWEEVQSAFDAAITDDWRRERMKEGTNIFRVLVKTLLKAGIITERTREVYAPYVNLDELTGEGDRMVGDGIAADGVRLLKEINAPRRRRAG